MSSAAMDIVLDAYEAALGPSGPNPPSPDRARPPGDGPAAGAPGTLGDITILSGDVTAASPDEIRAMTVIATIVGGLPAYCADPETCSRLGG